MPIGADIILISLPLIAAALILQEDRRITNERKQS
jgi:hypothetical protein